MAKKAPKGPKTLFDLVHEIDPYFTSEVYSATEEKLMDKLGVMAKDTTSIENAKEDDEDIKKLTEQKTVALQTYTVPLKALKLKRKLIYKILEERGKTS